MSNTATVSEIMNGVYELLRSPKTADLSVGTVYSQIHASLEFYLNKLNLSDSNWILNTKAIDVIPTQKQYPLSIDDFGRAVLLETMVAGSEFFVRRNVDIVDLQDIQPVRIEPILSANSQLAYYKHNATRVAFFVDGSSGVLQILFDPPPTASCTYKLYYEPVGITKPEVTESPLFLQNFTTLLKVDVARKCLRLLAEVYSDKLYKALDNGIMMDLTRLETQFDQYIANMQQESPGFINSFSPNTAVLY